MLIHQNFEELFSLDNIFITWRQFRLGKAKKYDVQFFERHLEDNIFKLFARLHGGDYCHGRYSHFVTIDNKKRDIYKAEVADRLVHQIIYTYLTKIFEPTFIDDSYSSRLGKGNHRALKTAHYFLKLLGSRRVVYLLKCDIRKYFDHLRHDILLSLIAERVADQKIVALIGKIVSSFSSTIGPNCGVPLGNVTSQIFANIYLDVLDQFIKNDLRVRHYLRYNDDFILFDLNRTRLLVWQELIVSFADRRLGLIIPPNKISLRKINWGVDFLGFILLPAGLLLRPKTKAKIFSDLDYKNLPSKFGVLKHCHSYQLRQKFRAHWLKGIDLLEWN